MRDAPARGLRQRPGGRSLLGAAVTALALAASALAPAAVAAQHSAASSRFTRIRLDARGVDSGRLQRLLALRVPDTPIDRARTPLPPDGVYVGVDRSSPSTARIEVVTADGRGYDRTVEVAPDDPERALATELATLLAAVERGQERPDATGVRVPKTAATKPATRAKEGDRSSDAKGKARSSAAAGAAATAHSTWRIGFGVAPQLVLGVAPNDVGGPLTGAGASFEGRAQAPRTPSGGLVILGGMRALGNRGAGISLTRLRIHALGGWLWPLADAEVELVGGLSIEPWWLRDREGVLPGRSGEQVRAPLVGPLARVAAGGVVPAGPAILRIGGHLELATSFAAGPGRPAPGIVVRRGDDDDGTREAFRLGGLELVLGLDVAVTWPLRLRREPRP